MGRHQGWRVTEDGASFRGWVRVGRRYVTRNWPTAREAQVWAMGEAVKLASGKAVTVVARSRTAELKDAYLERLRQRGRSDSHLGNVTRTLEGLTAAAPDMAAADAAERIQAWLDEQTCSATSKNRMLVEVRGLVNWARRWKRLADDPTAPIERYSQGHYLRSQLDLGACRTVARALDDPYHLWMAVALYTGMRAREVQGLRWEDIDWSGRIILVLVDREASARHAGRQHGRRVKRRRERIVPLHDELAAIIDCHHPVRPASGPVFGSMVLPTILWRRCRRFLARQGLAQPGLSPHSLRHTYAGLMTATGEPEGLLANYLGHEDSDTTMGYQKLSARYAQAIAGAGWERGRFRLLAGWSSPWPRACPPAPAVAPTPAAGARRVAAPPSPVARVRFPGRRSPP